MGEDKWAHREPGSAAGSVVPPPVVQKESPPTPPPLPRRKPKASGHQRAADADRLITTVRRVSGSPGPDLSVSAADSPPLPDNVRYLFSSAPPAPPVEQPAVEQADTKVEQPDASQPHERVKRLNTASAAGGHRRAVASQAGGKLRRRITWVAAVLVVCSTAVGTAFALVRHGPANSASQQNAGPRRSTRGGHLGPKVPALSSAAIVRAQAARWVAKEISKSAIIACDDVMCNELFNQGIAASNLLVLGPTAASPLGADLVIGTRALRSQFGQRLAGEYAPTVIASFGAGKSRVDVRVIAADGAAAYGVAESHDLAARQRYGGELLRNSRISVSASARPDLIAGLVDPRLLMMLPVLAHQHPIKVIGFYDRAPGSAQGVPLSGAELAGSDAGAGLPARSYLRWLLVFLRGQRAPYWPTDVNTEMVGGHEIVRVRFSRPSPIGLLNGQ